MKAWSDEAYTLFEIQQRDRGIDVDAAVRRLSALAVETPSWGYGDSGTRFKVFQKEGVPRNPYEKIDDAAVVHQLTGACPSVAIHIPWDKVDDYQYLRDYALQRGLRIGAVNPNLFQDDDYMLGSATNADAVIRNKAIRHMLECVDVMREVGSSALSLWFADGTNYPGQGHIRRRKRWLQEALTEVYAALDPGMRMLIEYKFFEPGFYHTDLADWGMALQAANQLGGQAQVLVDIGHHAPGTNVEHIVAYLLDEGKLGGFHFNSRKYADDDLIVGAMNPYELFLIFYQILDAERDTDGLVARTAYEIAYMIDQSHVIEPKIPAMIRSVCNIQTQFAKALLIQHEELQDLQAKNDVLGAEHAVRTAFEFDVTPLVCRMREERGLPMDPMRAYYESGYAEKICERGVGGSGW
ncbi:L-rhamnose isomerase/sugar isomerase [Alicyclobacillus sacchari]|uniref:L-rhamnose isomerase/sugar isomerase n=1 Tax=Alicyclobacillus sacchari TaxID=392010 RepID=A0A4R8LHA7_9BACL|nr:L-rhamnose isomerase [Alicyclobacillus sacchari]TDY42574.1 L-rhamnose isomerase/sugar isomerase [Alicyclobacillus sacchari]GMA58111.1 L-rhamnose isomerase [Alicyclobacillus sacchari]